MRNENRVKEVLDFLKDGTYQDPDKCALIPLEDWASNNRDNARKILVLVGIDDDSPNTEIIFNVLTEYIETLQFGAFMRGLSLGYFAFGNRDNATKTVKLEQTVTSMKTLLLYETILTYLGPDVLTRFAEIGDDNE